MQRSIQKPVDIPEIAADFPISGNLNCMNVVFLQELSRFNALLDYVHHDLRGLKEVLGGEALSTRETQELNEYLLTNRVPPRWHHVAYPTIRSLSSWLDDL